ncbi:hypothetical protein CsatB_009432 [Cannabis sativa]
MSSLLLFSHQREKFALFFGVKFLYRGHVLVISSTEDIFISFYFSASLSSPNSHNLKSPFRTRKLSPDNPKLEIVYLPPRRFLRSPASLSPPAAWSSKLQSATVSRAIDWLVDNYLASRSTRRKKAKRQRLREQAKARENELHQAQVLKADNIQQTSSLQPHQAQVPQTNNQQSSSKDNGRNSKEHQGEKCNGEEDNVVPIVVRPGHIRFELFGKEDGDQAIPQFKISEINFQWNGITSKRKGQQWGKEKTAFYKRNDQEKENPECSDMLVNEEEEKEDQEKTTVDVPLYFDKLKPCSIPGLLPRAMPMLWLLIIKLRI